MERYEYSAQQRSLLESLKVPLAVYQLIDRRVVTLILSAGLYEMFGYEEPDQAYRDMTQSVFQYEHPDDVARIANEALRFATEGGTYEVVYRACALGSSEYHIIHAQGRHVYTETGVRLAYVWYVDEGAYTGETDIKPNGLYNSLSNVLHMESILRASYFDHLTGLPSMAYFFELAKVGKEAILRRGETSLMLFFDLCGMKFYNTRYGFSEGDRLLRGFARLLVDEFSNDNCSRIGADHFSVYTSQEGLEEKLQRIFHRMEQLNGGNFIPVHVGIYIDQEENIPVGGAFDRAKIACDALNNVYSSCFRYYDRELKNDLDHRQYVLSHLDQAIREKWIQAYYQQIVDAKTGRVCDEEALARWIDPEKGMLSPLSFIPYLEDTGLIYKLDLFVLDQVLEKMNLLKERGMYLVPHSINLSRSDFDSCDIVEEICRRVDAAKIPRSMISIEITESVIGSDFGFIKNQAERFQSLGFPVWMDDFGSGYSSFDVLQSIRFDLLKFDMSFMKKLDEGENRRIVLTELMHMAGKLGLDTICEGVETAEQVEFLKKIGCSKLQGYYFSKPTSLEKELPLLEKMGK